MPIQINFNEGGNNEKIVLMILLSMLSTAKAETSITCEFAADKQVKVQIVASDFEYGGTLNKRKAQANIVLTGPGLFKQVDGTLIKTKIQTRTTYGDGYSMDLNDTESIELTNITYSPYPKDIGFTGIYFNEESKSHLNCEIKIKASSCVPSKRCDRRICCDCDSNGKKVCY